MTGTGSILVRCPPMGVWDHDPVTGSPYPSNWRKTERLKATVTLNLPDASILSGWLLFPETWVKPDEKTGFLKFLKIIPSFTVDECRADGLMDDGSPIWNLLEPEPVVVRPMFKPLFFYLVARAVPATGEVSMRDGSVGKMKLVYPDVDSYRQGAGHFLVDPVDARGIVEFGT